MNDLKTKISGEFGACISGYELGSIYFELQDYESAKNCVVKEGIEGFSLLDWKDLAYSIWKTDKELFIKQIEKLITEKQTYIDEIKSGHEDWNDDSDDEKKSYINDFKSEIEELVNLDTHFSDSRPSSSIDVWEESCGCLLFDCKRHNIQTDDE